jgi:hypothetical protein
MRGRAASIGLALIASGVCLTTVASAQERRAPAGPVVVREVQVREVRVQEATLPRLDDQRPSFGVERPVDPAYISRPIPRPQFGPSTSRPLNRGGFRLPQRDVNRRHGRNWSSTFQPRFNSGYGVVVGYPIIYPYAYPYDPFSPATGAPYSQPPGPNTYSNVASLSVNGNVTAASSAPAAIACEGAARCGGVSFDITPRSAQVYIDGSFAGLVEDFDAASEPLLLAPGDHYVEIRLAGYRTASLDVTVVASEVTPYQGTLERLRLRTP